MRIRRQVFDAFLVDETQTFTEDVCVYAGQWVLSCRRVRRVDKAEVKQVGFFVVNVGNKFATLADMAEAVDGFWVVLALRGREFDEANESLSVHILDKRISLQLTSGVHRGPDQEGLGI